MNIKLELTKLKWNTFEKYPPQFSAVYIHCYHHNRKYVTRKYMKIDQFNAVSFNPYDLKKILNKPRDWKFEWLPAELIEKQLKLNQTQDS